MLMSAQATIFEHREFRRRLEIGVGDVAGADDADADRLARL